MADNISRPRLISYEYCVCSVLNLGWIGDMDTKFMFDTIGQCTSIGLLDPRQNVNAHRLAIPITVNQPIGRAMCHICPCACVARY